MILSSNNVDKVVLSTSRYDIFLIFLFKSLAKLEWSCPIKQHKLFSLFWPDKKSFVQFSAKMFLVTWAEFVFAVGALSRAHKLIQGDFVSVDNKQIESCFCLWLLMKVHFILPLSAPPRYLLANPFISLSVLATFSPCCFSCHYCTYRQLQLYISRSNQLSWMDSLDIIVYQKNPHFCNVQISRPFLF